MGEVGRELAQQLGLECTPLRRMHRVRLARAPRRPAVELDARGRGLGRHDRRRLAREPTAAGGARPARRGAACRTRAGRARARAGSSAGTRGRARRAGTRSRRTARRRPRPRAAPSRRPSGRARRSGTSARSSRASAGTRCGAPPRRSPPRHVAADIATVWSSTPRCARDAGRERVLVVGRLVGDRRVERDDAGLLVARERRDEARVDSAGEERPDRARPPSAAARPRAAAPARPCRPARRAARARAPPGARGPPARRGRTSAARDGSSVSRSTASSVPGSTRSTPSNGVARPFAQPWTTACATTSRSARRGTPAAKSARISLANHSAPPWRAQYSGLTPQRSRARSSAPPLEVERRQPEQAVEARQRRLAPAREGLEHAFGVGMPAPRCRLELAPQVEVVEDLAVVGEPPAAGRVPHRLVAGRGRDRRSRAGG